MESPTDLKTDQQSSMYAIQFDQYGGPTSLAFMECPKPVPGPQEVLLRIKASSVNDWDWGLVRGKPFINRLLFGMRKPKVKTLGIDVSGGIEAIGEEVSAFQVGDEVYGDISEEMWGGFAEYVCVPETALRRKPANLSYEQAACLPHSGVLAIQSFLDHGGVQPGQEVLINGAGGGAGTIAIQLVKHWGGKVTAVDKGSKFASMQQLGADACIDYLDTDFTQQGKQYDWILDLAGYHPLRHYKRSLTPNGQYLMVGGGSGLIIKAILFGKLMSLGTSKSLKIMPHKPNKHLDSLTELVEQGIVTPIIGKIFPLQEASEAVSYFGKGISNGKVIVRVKG